VTQPFPAVLLCRHFAGANRGHDRRAVSCMWRPTSRRQITTTKMRLGQRGGIKRKTLRA